MKIDNCLDENNLDESCLDEICMCGKDAKSTNHFLFHCSPFLKERQVLMNKICDIYSSLIDQNKNSLFIHLYSLPETLKYWVGVQWGQSYLMWRRG